MAGVRVWHWLLPLIAWTAFSIRFADKPQRGCARSLTDPDIKDSILFSAPQCLPPPALYTTFERIAWLAVSDVDYETLGNRALKATGEAGMRSIFDTHVNDWWEVADVMRELDWMQVIARNRSDQRDMDLEELAYVQGDGELPLQAAKDWACHQPPYRSTWPLVAFLLCWDYRSFWRSTLPSTEFEKMWFDVVELTKATKSLVVHLHKHRKDMQQYRVNLVVQVKDIARQYDKDYVSYNSSDIQALRTRFLVSTIASAQSAALLDFADIALQLLEDTYRDLRLLREDIRRIRKRASTPPAEAILTTRQRVSDLRINGSYANTIYRLVDIFDNGIAILESRPNEAQAHPVWYEISQFWKQSYDEEDASRARRCMLGVAIGGKILDPDCLAVAECPVWKEWHASEYQAERFWGDSLKMLQIGTRARKKRQ